MFSPTLLGTIKQPITSLLGDKMTRGIVQKTSMPLPKLMIVYSSDVTRKLVFKSPKQIPDVTVKFTLNLIPEGRTKADNMATNVMNSVNSSKTADNKGSTRGLGDLHDIDQVALNTQLAVDEMANAPSALGAIGNVNKAIQPWESLRGSISGLMQLVDGLAEVYMNIHCSEFSVLTECTISNRFILM